MEQLLHNLAVGMTWGRLLDGMAGCFLGGVLGNAMGWAMTSRRLRVIALEPDQASLGVLRGLEETQLRARMMATRNYAAAFVTFVTLRWWLGH